MIKYNSLKNNFGPVILYIHRCLDGLDLIGFINRPLGFINSDPGIPRVVSENHRHIELLNSIQGVK